MHNRKISRELLETAANPLALCFILKRAKLSGGALSDDTLTAIRDLSDHNFTRLNTVLCDLDDIGHLNKETVTLAVQRVTQKLLDLPVTTHTKTRHPNFMGRRARLSSTAKGPAIVTDLLSSQPLGSIKDVDHYTPERRIKWLASGLRDVEKLHAHFRLHGGISPGSFLLDIKTDKMKLIGFGNSKKVGSTKAIAYTSMFVDMKDATPRHTGNDMFSMGYIVAVLFPEILTLKAHGERVTITTPSGEMKKKLKVKPPFLVEITKAKNINNTAKAVIALLNAMMEPNREDRCTSQQALLFCNHLIVMLTGKKDITADELKSLLDSTINRNAFEAEDALRGSKRAAKFGFRSS